MDELSLRALFHGALDEVAPPKPWLVQGVRDELRRRRPVERSARRFRLWSPAIQRAIAAVLILLIAVTATVATIAIYQRTHHQVPVINSPGGPVTRSCGTTGPGGVRMFDKNVGWRGTERTTDGGATWHDVSPPTPPGAVKGGGATCMLNPNVAWQVYGTGTGSYQPNQLVLMSTHDAGQTWLQTGQIAVPWNVSWRINFSVFLDFYDLQHGWLFMEYATQPLQRRVYATTDGGIHWTPINMQPDLGLANMGFDCSLTGLMFDSLLRGWLTWGCSSGFGDKPGEGTPIIAMTNDGGKTWAPLLLDGLPPSNDQICDASSPVFTNATGLLEVICGGANGLPFSNALYSTANGGTTWTRHVVASYTAVDVVTGTTAFYFQQSDPNAPNTLYRTSDGGAHWTVVARGLFPGGPVDGLYFIDEKTGLVNVDDSPGPWWTFDGGKTWALRPPYRSAGNTVCGLFTGPGGEFQLPRDVKMVSPNVGWAPGARRTTDGGVHWTHVAPPQPKNFGGGYGEFFLDANDAWVVYTAGTATSCADRFVVYRTTDGAASWQQASTTIVGALSAAEKLAGGWTVSVEFMDRRNGWILAQTRSGYVPPTSAALYRTSDGGKTWSLVAAQAIWSGGGCSGQGLPLFSSPTTGWVSDTCTGAAASSLNVLVTRDGGQTWTNVEVSKNYCDLNAYPNGCLGGHPEVPQFFDADNGVLIDWFTPQIFTTSDGGQTWTRHPIPPGRTYTCQGKFGLTTCTTLGLLAASFISSSEGWLAMTDYAGEPSSSLDLVVLHTTDGGKTWTIIYRRHSTIQSDQGEFFQFVDSNHGFWWFGDVVTQTSDGGRTWTSTKVSYQ